MNKARKLIANNEAEFSCDCGHSKFKKVKPENVKNPKGGTKHIYRCNKCKIEWWSFFYNMETGKRNKFK
jgi:predicted SprT family Zn-dependent metalloprotease